MSGSAGGSTRFIAAALLTFCGLALIVGLVNTLTMKKPQHAVQTDNGVASLLESRSIVKRNRLLAINLNGPISMEPSQRSLFSDDSDAMLVRKALDKAAKDSTIKGVLLRINSPGGTVSMSQELNKAVYRVSKEKPVVASLGDMAASGGYYTACAADRIIANPGTLTGSIGVIISTLNLQSLMEDKLGVKTVTIKSGKFKDLLSPYRSARPDELALMQQLIDESYKDFLGAVLAGRTRSVADATAKEQLAARITSVADGRILGGEQAKAMGLVDEIGDAYYAQKVLEKMAKAHFGMQASTHLPLEEYSETGSLWNMLGLPAALARFQPAISVPSLSPEAAVARVVMPFSARHPNEPLWIRE